MAGELPETGGVEAAVELGARVACLRLGGALVGCFCLVEVPLLLVGDEFDGDQADEEAREGDFDDVHVRVEAGGEEEEVGWGCDGEEEDLGGLLVRGLENNGWTWTYALERGGEEDVQEEESGRADPAFDQVPSVVFAADLVASTAPVVESQTDRP